MTNITLYLDEHDKFKGFRASGHAGYRKAGSDIVCAAISVLLTNTINSFDELLHTEYEFDSDEETGFMDFKVKDYDNDPAQLLFKSLKLGLDGVQESYPKFLNLKLSK